MSWDPEDPPAPNDPVQDRYNYWIDRAFNNVRNHYHSHPENPLEMYQKRLISVRLSAHTATLMKVMFRGIYELKEIRDDQSF